MTKMPENSHCKVTTRYYHPHQNVSKTDSKHCRMLNQNSWLCWAFLYPSVSQMGVIPKCNASIHHNIVGAWIKWGKKFAAQEYEAVDQDVLHLTLHTVGLIYLHTTLSHTLNMNTEGAKESVPFNIINGVSMFKQVEFRETARAFLIISPGTKKTDRVNKEVSILSGCLWNRVWIYLLDGSTLPWPSETKKRKIYIWR